MKLLLIEDDAKFAETLALTLRKLGYAVENAVNGEKGLELAETNEYDLLILDLNLPDMDGLDVCRHLRASQPCLLIMISLAVLLKFDFTPDYNVLISV